MGYRRYEGFERGNSCLRGICLPRIGQTQSKVAAMTNTLALILMALILAAIGLDLMLGSGITIGAGRMMVRLVNWMAFWR